MRISGLLTLLFFLQTSFSQELEQFNKERLNIDNKLMLSLGSWSLANAGVSTYGWTTTENEAKYFHQMNTIWCVINLGLAIPSYIRTFREDPSEFSFRQTWKKQIVAEKTFLLNSGLDVGYIASGFWLRSAAKNNPEDYHRFTGWGNAVILQGGFLLLLDVTAAIIHTQHRKNKLNGFLDRVEMSDTGLGLKLIVG